MKGFFFTFFSVFFLLVPFHCLAEDFSGQADIIPWSGYWWPRRSGELVTGYQGDPSPFQKYDLITQGSLTGDLTRWGLVADNGIYVPSAFSWEGYCHAWAAASLLENYDFLPSFVEGVLLNTGDKKGFATFLYQGLSEVDIGTKCDDPLDFHVFMLDYVDGEHGLGLGMCADLDPSEEVWTYPIFKYSGEITSLATYDDVSVTIYFANDDVDPDYPGTQQLSKNYTYRLYKDDYGYTEGEWTGASIDDHPELCWFPPGAINIAAPIDPATVRALIQNSDQGLPDAGTLLTGHNRILLDYAQAKFFLLNVPATASDVRFHFIADSQRQANTYFTYNLYKNGELVYSGDFDDETTYSSPDFAGSSLTLELDYSNVVVVKHRPIACHVYFDLDLPNTVHLPGYQRALWHGLAISNTSEADTSNAIFPTFYTTSGEPQLGYGPIVLGQGQHWASLIDGLDWIDTNDYDQATGDLKITSEKPIETLRLFGREDSLAGAFSSRTYPAEVSRWVVPCLTSLFSTTTAKLFITNTSNAPVEGQMHYYRTSGTFLGTSPVSLAALATGEYGKGDYPGDHDISGWALLDDPQGLLAGTIQYQESYSLRDEISFLTTDTDWRVLHPAALSGWSTELLLFNVNDTAVEVNLDLLSPQRYEGRYTATLAAHEKKSLTLTGALWGLGDEVVDAGSVEIAANADIAGYVTYRHDGGGLLASLPLVNADGETTSKVLGHVASNDIWWTGIVLYNPEPQPVTLAFRGLNEAGEEIASTTRTIGGYNKLATLGRELFPDTHQNIVTIRMTGTTPFAGYALFGDLTSPGFSYLSALIM